MLEHSCCNREIIIERCTNGFITTAISNTVFVGANERVFNTFEDTISYLARFFELLSIGEEYSANNKYPIIGNNHLNKSVHIKSVMNGFVVTTPDKKENTSYKTVYGRFSELVAELAWLTE